MRLHLDDTVNRLEIVENERFAIDDKHQDEIKEIKREKRRLDDLLTIRENENDNMKIDMTGLKQALIEKEHIIAEYEKKLKHYEKKYEKSIMKL